MLNSRSSIRDRRQNLPEAVTVCAAHDELNVYQSAEARFEIAAQKLGLEEGVYRYMSYPSKEITVYIPVMLDSGHSKSSSAIASSTPRFAGRARAASASRPTSRSTKSAPWPPG